MASEPVVILFGKDRDLEGAMLKQRFYTFRNQHADFQKEHVLRKPKIVLIPTEASPSRRKSRLPQLETLHRLYAHGYGICEILRTSSPNISQPRLQRDPLSGITQMLIPLPEGFEQDSSLIQIALQIVSQNPSLTQVLRLSDTAALSSEQIEALETSQFDQTGFNLQIVPAGIDISHVGRCSQSQLDSMQTVITKSIVSQSKETQALSKEAVMRVASTPFPQMQEESSLGAILSDRIVETLQQNVSV